MNKTLVIIFLLFTFNLNAQSTNDKQIDSIISLLATEKIDTSKAVLNYRLACKLLKSDSIKAKYLGNQCLSISKRTNFNKGVGLYYTLLARQHMMKGNLKKCNVTSEQGLKYFENEKKDKDFYSVLYLNAFAKACLGDFEKSKKLTLDALHYLGDSKDIYNKNKFYLLLGNINFYQNNYKEALENYHKVINTAKKSQNTINTDYIIYGYIGVANAYIKSSQLSLALKYTEKGLLLSKYSNSTIHAQALCLIKKGEILNKMGKYKEAILILEKGVAIHQSKGNKPFIANGLLHLGESYYGQRRYKEVIKVAESGLAFKDDCATVDLKYLIGKTYAKLKDYAEAKECFRSALNSITANPFLTYEISKKEVHHALSNVEFKTGDYKNAYIHLNEYSRLKDQFIANLHDIKIAELQTKFDVKEKDIKLENLTLLRKKEKAKLSIQENYNHIFAYTIILTSVLTFFFIAAYIIIKKKNKLLVEGHKIIDLKMNQLEISENALKKSVSQKELLIKEVHHRVKNNLQIVLSLLKLQSRKSENIMAGNILKNCESRIYAMALIHQNLYQSESLDRINLNAYINQLVNHITATFFDNNTNINFAINVDNVYLEIDELIPLGLIINELVNNALKHAFPNNKKGTITVNIEVKNNNEMSLIVADSGIGMNEKADFRKTLGLELVHLMVKQLKGTITATKSVGLKYDINFTSLKIANET